MELRKTQESVQPRQKLWELRQAQESGLPLYKLWELRQAQDSVPPQISVGAGLPAKAVDQLHHG